jgi:hypothetical protein
MSTQVTSLNFSHFYSSKSRYIGMSKNLENICREILRTDTSIRYSGIANHLGSLVATAQRDSLVPLMTKDETSKYALQAVLRAAIREDFESKIGTLEYSIGKYKKLIRATVPIAFSDNNENKRYLLLSLDVNADATSILENKVLPLIAANEKKLI